MIPEKMKTFLQDNFSKRVLKNRVITEGPFRFLEFGPLDLDSLLRLGIKVDRLGPRLVSCMWDHDSPIEIGGFLVVDNLAMGAPSMGGTRMVKTPAPDIIHNLARGMTLKNAAADLPFGGGKSGIIEPEDISSGKREKVIKGFGRLLKRYRKLYIPGPDVGTNDADMKIFAIENGLNNVVSKPADMGGNRIDELGGAAHGIVLAVRALVTHLPELKQLSQFRQMKIPKFNDLDILIQGFGAVGAHAARLFDELAPEHRPVIKGISDETGYLLGSRGLPVKTLFQMWRESKTMASRFYHDRIIHGNNPDLADVVFSNACDNLLRESAFCLVPASPVSNYLGLPGSHGASMTTDSMGQWQMIVEGANTYSPDPARKAERRKIERLVYREKGILIAADYLVNSGGVIYAAHERLIPTPDHLLIPKNILKNEAAIEKWLNTHEEDFARLAETRQKAAVKKLETVMEKNMAELINGLIHEPDSLPCETAENISVQRIASREKARTARDIMEDPLALGKGKSVADAAGLLIRADVPLVVIVSASGTPVGVVTNRDITRTMALKLAMDSPVTDIMTCDVISMSPDASIIDCIRVLETHKISAMPIVENNRVTGMISGDILAKKTLFRLLQTMD
ncbi:MAG: Glu/Leu/Phe/Val dehydrogenase dimerization domain-containing protein [Desulfobacteraceae bacterium]